MSQTIEIDFLQIYTFWGSLAEKIVFGVMSDCLVFIVFMCLLSFVQWSTIALILCLQSHCDCLRYPMAITNFIKTGGWTYFVHISFVFILLFFWITQHWVYLPLTKCKITIVTKSAITMLIQFWSNLAFNKINKRQIKDFRHK